MLVVQRAGATQCNARFYSHMGGNTMKDVPPKYHMERTENEHIQQPDCNDCYTDLRQLKHRERRITQTHERATHRKVR